MSRLAYLFVAAAVIAAVPATASADHPTRPDTPIASSQIREMTSERTRGGFIRASSGHDRRGPYLVVEIFRRGRRGGDRMTQQYRFDEVELGRRTMPLSSMRELRQLHIQNNQISFVAEGRRRGGDLSCRVQLRRQVRAPSCVALGHGGTPTYPVDPLPGPEPMPHPVLPEPDLSTGPWASRADVIRACGDTFSGNQLEAECLRAVDRARRDPIDLIRACDRAMEGDPNELACVRAGAQARGEVAGAIDRCENAMEGDANELACIQVAANDSRAPSLVDACEKAMEGDPNELRCVEIAIRLPGDVAATIDACERAASGDDGELACIQAAHGRQAR